MFIKRINYMYIRILIKITPPRWDLCLRHKMFNIKNIKYFNIISTKFDEEVFKCKFFCLFVPL